MLAKKKHKIRNFPTLSFYLSKGGIYAPKYIKKIQLLVCIVNIKFYLKKSN